MTHLHPLLAAGVTAWRVAGYPAQGYSPDFVIRQKPPGVDGERGAKAMAVRRWVGLNPERLRYEMIFTNNDTVAADRLDEVRRFAAGGAVSSKEKSVHGPTHPAPRATGRE